MRKTVVAHKRKHSLRKLGVAGNIQRCASVKNGQWFTVQRDELGKRLTTIGSLSSGRHTWVEQEVWDTLRTFRVGRDIYEVPTRKSTALTLKHTHKT